MIRSPTLVRSFLRRSGVALLGSVAFAVASTPGVRAQSGADYLFGRPAAHVGFHVGVAVPRAESDVFAFTTDELIMDRDDFRSPVFGISAGLRATERLDVSGEVAFARSSTDAEYRDFIGTDDLPIVQTTTLARVPFSLVLRAYLWDRGRSVGRLAWVPSAWVPYVGVGGGGVWYEFAREGEFVDETTLEIFRDRVTWDGVAGTVHVSGGAEVSLSPRFLLRGEGRYSWASGGDLDRDFVGFDDIDLAGFQAVVGLSIRLGP